MKKILALLISAMVSTVFGNMVNNGTGFFVNDSYIVTASHTISDRPFVCIFDPSENRCYEVSVVVNNPELDIAILKLGDKRGNLNPQACDLYSNEVDEGTTLWTYGFENAFVKQMFDIQMYRSEITHVKGYHGDSDTYRIDTRLKHGFSGGPSFDATGRVVGISRAVSNIEDNVSLLIKSSLVADLLDRYDIQVEPTTRNGKKCTFIVVNAEHAFEYYFGNE